jgi:hypothetical protein
MIEACLNVRRDQSNNDNALAGASSSCSGSPWIDSLEPSLISGLL